VVIARRFTTLLTASLALAVLAACDSSGGKPHQSKSVTPASVSSELSSAVGAISSATVSIDASLAGQKIKGNGPATFDNGALTAIDLSGSLPGVGDLRILLSDGAVYAQLPKSLNTSGKPWVRVRSGSGNLVVGQLASVIDEIRSAASLTNLVTLVKASTAVKDNGGENIDGVDTTHYTLTTDPAKLPANFPGRDDLLGKLKGKPTDLWLDDKGRPAQLKRSFLVLGQVVVVTIGAKDFNKTVTISAPPPGDVATD
jgi:hypothetical protein